MRIMHHPQNGAVRCLELKHRAVRSVSGPTFDNSNMRNLARRHPIALYLAIVFGLGVPLMMLGVLASRGIIPGGGSGRSSPSHFSCERLS